MARRTPLYLGVDGGGTRCRARIQAEDGAGLGEGGSGPATTRLGIERAWRSIMEACEAALEQAELIREDLGSTHAAIALAGIGRRGAESALQEIVHPFASIRFISDGLAACLGAHGGEDGAIVVAGTGSIGVGLIGGREVRYGGYGFPISDQGSGADIGLHAIRSALRAVDGRTAMSPLLAELLGAFDHDPYHTVAWSEQATATDYAAFAPMVLRHANQGDPVGRRIVERAADSIGDLLDIFLHQGLERLSLVGGLSAAIAPWLTPDLRDRLKPPEADAVAGALLVARRPSAMGQASFVRRETPSFHQPDR